KMKNSNWHSKKSKEVISFFNANPSQGLSKEEVKNKLNKFGKNELERRKKKSKLKIFLAQFNDPFVYILITVGAAVTILGEWPKSLFESSFIFIAILINAIFGFWEENKASNTFEKLRGMLKAKALALREGNKTEVLQKNIVPGDIILLHAGDKVPADGRLLETENLSVSEAVLTGESMPIEKETTEVKKETPLAERNNMVYSGSLVKKGIGKFVVTATGKDTEAGKIASLIEETKEEKTPLQKKLADFSWYIGIAIGIITIIIFAAGVFVGKDPLVMFETAAAVSVGGIPEALPVIMTLTLALGMERLSKKKGLVRKLSSVETLGSTSIICCDKTKTLTKGEMTSHLVITKDNEYEIKKDKDNSELKEILKIASLGNSCYLENEKEDPKKWILHGEPTDKALFNAGKEVGLSKPDLENNYHLIKRFSFDGDLKAQAGIYEKDNQTHAFITGAPELLLEKSNLNKEEKDYLNNQIDKRSLKGERIIGLAHKNISKDKKDLTLEKILNDINFSGLIAMEDPLREGVKEAIKTAKEAGVRPIIITGDHKKTAKAIAEKLGIRTEDKNILEGNDLENMTESELVEIIEDIDIYARAEPKHKIKIVDAWQDKGEVVAMTGDGVNDAPALKKADVGLALGSGTEIAKETADIILLNNSFSIIVDAIEEGRTILSNIRKAITYVVADSFSAVILVGSSIILGWPVPILWTQILWNNLVEDTFPNIAYAFEDKEKGAMKRPPNPKDTPLLNREMKLLIFALGILRQFFVLGIFWFIWKRLGMSVDYARTMVFGSICVDSAFVVYSYKHLRKNIWEIDLFDNKLLMLATPLVLLAFSLAIYFPPLQSLLSTTPLGVGSWLILLIISFLAMVTIELTKLFFIKTKNS
ncbi:MAG: cation-translocating P-type ATPase, partial [Patescibacteria group bacterium]